MTPNANPEWIYPDESLITDTTEDIKINGTSVDEMGENYALSAASSYSKKVYYILSQSKLLILLYKSD